MEQAFNREAKDELDVMIARMFYSGGLSFNLTSNPYYAMAFTFAANNPIAYYKPPVYNSLRTTLVQHEKSHVERLLDPIRAHRNKMTSLFVVIDGRMRKGCLLLIS